MRTLSNTREKQHFFRDPIQPPQPRNRNRNRNHNRNRKQARPDIRVKLQGDDLQRRGSQSSKDAAQYAACRAAQNCKMQIQRLPRRRSTRFLRQIWVVASLLSPLPSPLAPSLLAPCSAARGLAAKQSKARHGTASLPPLRAHDAVQQSHKQTRRNPLFPAHAAEHSVWVGCRCVPYPYPPEWLPACLRFVNQIKTYITRIHITTTTNILNHKHSRTLITLHSRSLSLFPLPLPPFSPISHARTARSLI